MCSSPLHHRNNKNLVEPFAFSPFHFLRTRNRLIVPNTDTDSTSCQNLMKHLQIQPQLDALLTQNYETGRSSQASPILDVIENSTNEELPNEIEYATSSLSQDNTMLNKSQFIFKPIELDLTKLNQNENALSLSNLRLLPMPGTSSNNLNYQSTLPAFEYLTPAVRNLSPIDLPLMELNRAGGMFPSFLHRRPRGEKRPIPEEQKDDKYYERRKRNNEAAKKSRDARKIREDRIAFRAAFLEQENSLLRAQVMALRDELQTMSQIIGRGNIP